MAWPVLMEHAARGFGHSRGNASFVDEQGAGLARGGAANAVTLRKI